MAKKFDENSRVKIPAILHLTRLNYLYVSYRKSESLIDAEINIYKKSFQDALNKINHANFNVSDVETIIRELKNLLQAEDLGRKFFEKLQSGLTFNGENVRLIDFENIDNNIFEVMTEVPYKSGNDSFRPDITIFVNGLPLAFIEVKIPDNSNGIFQITVNMTTAKFYRWKGLSTPRQVKANYFSTSSMKKTKIFSAKFLHLMKLRKTKF